MKNSTVPLIIHTGLCHMLYLIILLPACGSAYGIAGDLGDDIVLPALYAETLGVPYSYEHRIRSGVYEFRGDNEDAVRELAMAVEGDPQDALLRTELARLLLLIHDTSGAARQIGRALAIDPAFQPAWLVLADIHLAENNPAGAEQAAQTGVRVDPYRAKALFWLGYLYEKQGQIDKAIAHFQDGLRIEPLAVPEHLVVGRLLQHQGRSGEIRVHMNAAFHAGSEDAAPLLALSEQTDTADDSARRIEMIEAFLQVHPENDALRLRVIDLLIAATSFARAGAHIGNLFDRSVSQKGVLMRAALRVKAHDLWGGRNEIVDLWGEFPVEPEVRLSLARIEMQLGRKVEAELLLNHFEEEWPEVLLPDVQLLRTQFEQK